MAKTITKKFVPDPRPLFRIEGNAYCKILNYVKLCEREISWHGFVTRGQDDNAHIFTLHDVILFPQTVNFTYCKLTGEYYTWYKKNISIDQEFEEQCKLFGHSHITGDVSPSDCDKQYYANIVRDFVEYGDEYYIFMIMNRAEKMDLQIFDYKTMVKYYTEDIDCRIVKSIRNPAPSPIKDIRKEIEKNVSVGVYRYSG